MKNTVKIGLVLFVLVLALILIPSVSNAAEKSVADKAGLIDAITNATDGDVITLTDNIVLDQPLSTDKDITINGKFTISADESWTSTSGNQTMITALTGAEVTIEDITLQGGPKYGVQAYNGGKVILDGVIIQNCKYGGVLVNGGIAEIRNLNLGKNGTGANNGVEIGKASGVSNDPKVIMNGTISSTEAENVIYIAQNDSLSTFEVENTQSSTYKLYTTGKQVVVTDSSNNVVFASNESGKEVTISDGEATEKVILNIKMLDTTKTIAINKGSILTEELLKAQLNIDTTKYILDGFYSDEDYKTEFDFKNVIDADTDIYVKLSLVEDNNEPTTPTEPTEDPDKTEEGEKDETPKTGVSNYIVIAGLVVVASIATVVILNKKNN